MSADTPPPSPRRVAYAYALLGLTMLIWSSAFAGIRVALRELSPLELTTARMVIAALGAAALGLALGVKPPARRDLPSILVAGIAGFACYHTALNFGLTHVSAGQASFLIATTPIWTALLATRLLGERLGRWGALGVGVSVSGVAVMSLGPSDLSVGVGSLLALGAAACAGVNITLQKDLLARYSPIDVSVHATLAGTLPFFAHLPFAAPSLMDMSTEGLVVTTYLGLGPICLGYVLSTIALAILPATRSAQAMLAVPPMAAFIAWIWIGEQPHATIVPGGALILIGLLLGARQLGHTRAHSSTSAVSPHHAHPVDRHP
jgi:drug/metabolite transporter (DMT)-like permease